MGFNFPNSPSTGTTYTPVGGPTYSWNGVAWQAVVQGVPVTVYVSDTAPPSPAIGQLWWDSDSGTMAIWYADADSAQWVQVSGSVSAVPPAGGGRLAYVSATALSFKPFNGGHIKIDGTVYAIPPAGIAGLANTGVFISGTAGQNLAVGTTYLISAFNNAGTVTACYWPVATGHSTSTTGSNVGVEIVSTDAHTLIGLVKTIAGGTTFADTATLRLVRTWFNDPGIIAQRYWAAGLTNASTSFVETSTERMDFLSWSGEFVNMTAAGTVSNSVVAAVYGQIYNDGAASNAQIQVSIPANGYTAGMTLAFATAAMVEGYHQMGVGSRVSTGTGTIGPFDMIVMCVGSGA